MFDLVIKSRNTVMPDGVKMAYVLIKDGLIADVVSESTIEAGPDVIDIGDNMLLPGLIDPHVHINEPGRTDWEGFDTATKAAIAGGITTLADMPLNASPVTVTVPAFEVKLAAAKNQLHANCGFWGGIVPGNENNIGGLMSRGVLGFKAFLTHSGIDDFPNVTETDLHKVMPVMAGFNLPLLVHCELSTPQQPAPDVFSYQDYLASRPADWEDNAIALMIRLCGEYRCPVHIVHLSSAGSISQIIRAKEQGLPLTVETAQHYLYFNAEDIPDGKTVFKCAPPIRDKANNQQLWEALEQGYIDFVATDHSPAPPNLKELESGNFTKAWGGISSLQFSLPALWTVARKNHADITCLIRWLSEGPARLMGLQNSKGKIAKGYDADLVVFNPAKTFTVLPEIIFHKHKITPYLHRELYGVVEQTYLSGVKVFDNGRFPVSNQGKIVMRNPDE
ncbi:MAG: allantoinase AllB [Chitinophagaceae bacterium]